ncbi:MAG: hypothetical protein ACPLZG_12530 [Thermoproteota archaeon]|jgi:hypothetical protein
MEGEKESVYVAKDEKESIEVARTKLAEASELIGKAIFCTFSSQHANELFEVLKKLNEINIRLINLVYCDEKNRT